MVVFDYFLHSLYTVINTQRGCHILKLKFRFYNIAGCCSILQKGHINLSSTLDQQFENHSNKYHSQQPLYNNLELLMMGIVMPETC